MNLSKYKWWRTLLHRVVAKKQSKNELTHPVCSHPLILLVGTISTRFLFIKLQETKTYLK